MTGLTLIFRSLARINRRGRIFRFPTLFAFGIFAPACLYAHQQPTTTVMLDMNPDKVTMELRIPLSELELAFGHDISQNPDSLVEKLRPQLSEYLLAHIHPVTAINQPWSVEVTAMKVEKAEQSQSGEYREITVDLDLLPPAGSGSRQFTLNYDVIMHQVVSHKAIVGIRNDWETGKTGAQPTTAGVIEVDTKTTKIFPLEINLPRGNWREGFKGMVGLGMQHIREGTDHLLFLFVLLLPATLRTNGKKWGEFGGTKYSVTNLTQIVTAFTLGHSITLLIGALELFKLPPQPVEILIAVSILVSAIHAIRPIFAGREMYVAAGFGLVHGLAFATVISNLGLGAKTMAISILGFNLGIELMQLFIVALTVPWLILLSLTPFYNRVRIIGATLAGIVAVAWIAERIFGQPNAVGDFTRIISQYAHFGIFILALIALSAFALQFSRKNSVSASQ